MDSVNMERQASLGLTVPDTVTVIGCGGVGSWVAYMLAMAGVKRLWLFDSDTVSDHNLNRIPLPATAVGKLKSLAVADLVHSVRPACNVFAVGRFTPEIADKLKVGESQWYVCTTDSLSSRLMVKKWADKQPGHYIEAAAEGETGSATGTPAEWATPEEDNPGYASVPVWVGPCVFAAGIAVAHVLHNTPMGDRLIKMGMNTDAEFISFKRFEIYDSETETEEETDYVSDTLANTSNDVR